MGRASGKVPPPAGDLDEEQHVQPLEPDCVDGKAINRDGASCLRAKELAPRWTLALAGWTETFLAQDLPDGGRRHGHAEAFQLGHDGQVAPPRIFARHAQNQLTNLLVANSQLRWQTPGELALLLIRTEFLCREVRQTLHKRCFQLVFREVQTLPRRIPSHTHAAIGV
jgi:hypothetical protein